MKLLPFLFGLLAGLSGGVQLGMHLVQPNPALLRQTNERLEADARTMDHCREQLLIDSRVMDDCRATMTEATARLRDCR